MVWLETLNCPSPVSGVPGSSNGVSEHYKNGVALHDDNVPVPFVTYSRLAQGPA